ncbi:MAG: hypothetical protein HRT67_01655 [Flavobacteriaceae bacterium]|nr:hypothetical protein [Flavobacteriaceae bacterium]
MQISIGFSVYRFITLETPKRSLALAQKKRRPYDTRKIDKKHQKEPQYITYIIKLSHQ